MSLLIREIHISEINIQRLAVIEFLPALILADTVKSGENPLRSRNRRLQLAVDLRQFIDRPAELSGIDDKCGNHTHGNQTVYSKNTAAGGNNHETYIADAVHHRSHNSAENLGSDPGGGKFIGNLFKLLNADPLPAECGHSTET